MTTPPLSTVVAGPSAVWVKRVASQIDASAGDLVSIDRADTLATAADLAVGRSAAVIVSIVDPAVEGFDPDDFADLRGRLATIGTRVVAVTRSISLGGLEPLLSHSTVDAILTDPWSPDGFDKVLCAQLATFVVGHRRDLVPVVGDYFTDDDFRRAELRLERRQAAPVHDVDRPHPLLDTSTED
ncbi:MAG: hypothetical protein KDB37_09785, partial [Ilumatobacter sp.]|nr:hypothetical protein [Ilumatobacter sp.]